MNSSLIKNKNIGDFHNFGKRVELISDKVFFKPRTVFWEWLFLDSSSPLRKFFEKNLYKNRNLFSCFPNLKILSNKDNNSGYAEKLELEPIYNFKKDNFEKIGILAGITTWFGIGDLHFENIAIGTDPKSGNFVLCPLDIESIFEDFHLISESALITPFNGNKNQSGFYSTFKLIKNFEPIEYLLEILNGFFDTINFLNKLEDDILKCITSSNQIYLHPVRVILRSTQEYRNYLINNTPVVNPYLYNSEIEQLNRFDIPYFFRFLNDTNIYYYVSNSYDYSISDVTQHISQFHISSFRKFSRNNLMFSNNRELLIKTGLLQLTRFFTDHIEKLEISLLDSKIFKNTELIQIQYNGKTNIQCAI